MLMVLAGVAQAQAQPAPAVPSLVDSAAVPGLDAEGRASYDRWLLIGLPRAVAVGTNGKIGWMSEDNTLAQTRAQALVRCQQNGGTGCRLYAENLEIVWPGRQQKAPPPPPPPLVSSINYAFAPDPRFFWQGPGAAAGVIVWAQGNNGPDVDLRGMQPPPLVRLFNNAGYDVIRFDRAPMADTVARARGWLEDELPALRKAGYRRIIVAGDSRGAWTSLLMLDTAGLAAVVIAVVPAAHGAAVSMNLGAQVADLRRIVAEAPPSWTRMAMVKFLSDPFMSDADTRVRLMERLRPKSGGVLLIDRPPGFTGHFGGGSLAFARRFGACLLHFAQDPAPPPSCAQQPHPEQ